MSSTLRTESFNARVRGTSHIDFKTATTGVAAKSMRNELSRLVSTVEDPVAKKVHSQICPLFYLTHPYSGFRFGNAELFLPLHSLPRRPCSKC